jgi:DNA-binding PadR family transcriptional regulator
MSLKYAVMAALLDGGAVGYDLGKRFDITVANFWHALPQQIYAELNRMEREGLVTTTTVVQERRPNKRVFTLSDAGREALRTWAEEPSRLASIKDELLVRLYAADIVDPEALLTGIEKRLTQHEARARAYEAIREALAAGRGEEEYIRTTRRLGQYLPLRLGIALEREHVAWCRWVLDVLRLRTEARSAASHAEAGYDAAAGIVDREQSGQHET